MASHGEDVSDVVIIGSGCVGSFVAFYAAHYKLKVTVLEKYSDVSMGTTNANSGIVHAGHNTTPGTIKAKYVDRGNALIRKLAPQLNFTYRNCGELVVARSTEDIQKLKDMLEYSRRQGIPVEEWDETTLRREEPQLNQNIKYALFAPTAGVVSPYEMTISVAQCAMQNGVAFKFDQEVVGIEKVDNLYRVRTREQLYLAKTVVNAAGLYADEIAKMVDPQTKIHIKPRKGEEYLLQKNCFGFVKRIIFPVPTGVSKGSLVIPTADGRLMVGPTADEVEDKEDRKTTASGLQRVFEAAKQLVPCVEPSKVVASFAGCRAADVSGDFVIDEHDGFINIAGIQSPGLTASPAIAEDVVNNLLSKTLQLIANAEFRIIPFMSCFYNMDTAKKIQLAKEDLNHTKIVCTCEMVSEADIQNAISSGARTLDGIKFRTRAGMGDCQGGFCTSRVMTILAERLGTSEVELTKRGGSTKLVHSHVVGNCTEGGRSMEGLVRINGNTPVKPYYPLKIEGTRPNVITNDQSGLQSIFKELSVDILIIGSGPAGLAAGLSAATTDKSARVLILERTERSGGILLQCIHEGFGLKRYRKELTGPEYAELLTNEAVDAGVHIVLSSYVIDVSQLEGGGYQVSAVTYGIGMLVLTTKTLITAVGCRERTRADVKIAGTRPAGIYTAGLAQAMINYKGQLPGKNIIILGSGDIGLIMARRCTLEGAHVIGVYEFLPRCSGLQRNVAQCLNDFNIPLYLSRTVTEIIGKDRIDAVKMATVDPVTLQPSQTDFEIIQCDCLLLSVGLTPQTKFVVKAGGRLHERTRNPIVDSRRYAGGTSFAAGNCLIVHDLADDAAEEGQIAGYAAAQMISGAAQEPQERVPVSGSGDVLFVVPQSLYASRDVIVRQKLSTRVNKPLGRVVMRAFYGDVEIGAEEVEEAVPAEMIHIQINQEKLHEAYQADTSRAVELRAEQVSHDHVDGKHNGRSEKSLTCIVCPRGCKIYVRVNEDNDIEEITGNSCPRGANYAKQEHIEPFRTFSSSIEVIGSRVIKRLPVKLSRPIPRSRIMEMADYIKTLKCEVGVKMGQVVAKKALGLCDIVACCSVGE